MFLVCPSNFSRSLVSPSRNECCFPPLTATPPPSSPFYIRSSFGSLSRLTCTLILRLGGDIAVCFPPSSSLVDYLLYYAPVPPSFPRIYAGKRDPPFLPVRVVLCFCFCIFCLFGFRLPFAVSALRHGFSGCRDQTVSCLCLLV